MRGSLRFSKPFLLLMVTAMALVDCNKRTDVPAEGFVSVEGGKIWYQITGKGPKTPLLLLHGGPGFPSAYLKPLAALGDERRVIFYDQLGSANSDQPQDSSLWNVARFADELDELRRKLNLDEVHILAHSWGTMLATEYLARDPTGIKTIIFASPAISVDRWLADANNLKRALPEAIRDTLNHHEQRGTTDSRSYVDATEEFYKRHVCRIAHTPEVKETFAGINMQVYGTMWGNNEFTCTGNLKTFDRTEILKRINIPVLFTCGEYDEATPATTAWYASHVAHVEIKVIADASHLTMNEKPEVYVKIVRDFLSEHE